MRYTPLSVIIAATLLTGCNSGDNTVSVNQENVEQTDITQQAEFKVDQITFINTNRISFDAPGISVNNISKVSQITTNFGRAFVDTVSGRMVFESNTSQQSSKSAQKEQVSAAVTNKATTANASSVSRLASDNNYRFKISYQIEDNQYHVSGYALPLYKKTDKTIVPRFVKVTANGDALPIDEQVMTREKSDWSCVTDASSLLTWQVLQSNGEFAFDSTYYWGDRVQHNRNFSEAVCGLNTVCNTDNLALFANAQALCGKTNWRTPTRNEWKTVLTNEMLNDTKRQSPIDRFFFPYIDANYDEAYWTNSFTQYVNGHDSSPIDGDWQGSNPTVGDAHVMWMGSDYSDDRMPPRSTNEPRFSILVSGTIIPDSAENTVDEITATLKSEINQAGDEDTQWQNRFTKNGPAGQPLLVQSAAAWSCTTDNFFKSVVPNTQILWQSIDKKTPLMSFEQANNYVNTININALCGRNDWRLPSESELKSLLIDSFAYGMEDMSYRAGYVNSVFNDTVVADDSYYWSKTADDYQPDNKHMAVAFQTEWSESSGESDTQLYRVRLISTSAIQP